MTPAEKWAQYQARWDVLSKEQSIAVEAVACEVCGYSCSQLNRCMFCRKWVHVKCTEDGICLTGCNVIIEADV